MVVNYTVEINRWLPINQQSVAKLLNQAAQILKLKNKLEVSVIVVGDKKIQTLNKNFRHKNKVTDVLSFRQSEGQKIVQPQELIDYLGEIFICWPQIVRQSKLYGNTAREEFQLMLVHGLLHLLGYDDQTVSADKKMKKIQDKIISKLHVKH
jgi:probable rRNA maturation factor